MIRLEVSSSSRKELIDITKKVKSKLKDEGIRDGICTLFVPHTTAGVLVNESADPDVALDIKEKLSSLVPADDGYRHREGNSDAHIKSSLVGNSIRLIIENGELLLGRWQGLFFCEFDGPRQREVWLKLSS